MSDLAKNFATTVKNKKPVPKHINPAKDASKEIFKSQEPAKSTSLEGNENQATISNTQSNFSSSQDTVIEKKRTLSPNKPVYLTQSTYRSGGSVNSDNMRKQSRK